MTVILHLKALIVLVPGSEELDELTALIFIFSAALQMFHLFLGQVREVGAAAPQTQARGGGGGAQARIRNRRCLAVPQEVHTT